MKNVFLLLTFILLQANTAFAANSNMQLKASFPAPNGNFANLKVSNSATVNNLFLTEQSCPGSGTACEAPGQMVYCGTLGFLSCLDDHLWGAIGGSDIWGRTDLGGGLINIHSLDLDGDVRLGLGTDAPRAQVHLYQEYPYNASLRLEHITSGGRDHWWQLNAKELTGSTGHFSISGGASGAINNDIFVINKDGQVTISDDYSTIPSTAPAGILNIQKNENAITQASSIIPPTAQAKIDPTRLTNILFMNKNGTLDPVNGQGNGIGFSVDKDGIVSSAIVAENAGGFANQSNLHFMVRVTPDATNLTSAMSISPRGKVTFGKPVGSINDALSADRNFALRGNFNFQPFEPALGPPIPNYFSITGLKTETEYRPVDVDTDHPANKNYAATLEYVQGAVAAAAASGSVIPVKTEVTISLGGGICSTATWFASPVQMDAVCNGTPNNVAAGFAGCVSSSRPISTASNCPTGTSPAPGSNMTTGFHWYEKIIYPGAPSTNFNCYYSCVFP